MKHSTATIAILGLALFLTTFATAQRYTVTEIAIQDDDTDATALNDHGAVAGTYRNPGTDVVHAFRFSNRRLIDDLGTLGGSRSFGQGVNNSGEIVGSSQLAGDLVVHAFVSKDGVMSDLGTLGGDSMAFGINRSGEVCGSAVTADHNYHAFLYSQGNMMDLGTLGGTSSFGEGLNRCGKVTGAAYLPGDSIYHAFLYENGSMTDLGSLADFSHGYAVNDKGQVAGETFVPNGIGAHAFLFTNGSMIDLGTFGGTISEGFGINNAGHVVGTANIANDQDRHAFIYISGKGMLDLNALIPSGSGWVLQVARAVNDKDEIVGFGVINGKSRAFLLEPVHRKK